MHLSRKLFHATGILVVLIYRGWPLEQWLASTLLWVIVGLLGLIDVLRWRFPAVQARFQAAFSAILAPKDAHGLNGSTLYFCGCALTVSLFPADAACAGVLCLALGDPMAAIVGSAIRSPRKGNVSVAGSSACFVAATLAALIFFPLPHALAAGAVATLLEAISGAKLDNLTIPVGAAAILHLL